MTEAVNNPPHYDPIDGVPFDCITVARDMTFSAGNAVKYMWRTDRKNGREDIEKALWYIKDAIAHGDQVHIGFTPRQWNARMNVLVLNQPNALRAEFFGSIRLMDLGSARIALERMLLE